MDLQLVETGNGGDLVKTAKDLGIVYGFENFPYIAMFGGNVEESTPNIRLTNRQYFDFWGNDLLMPKDAAIQFNSETERVLNTTPLNSSGRLKIEQAIKNDLRFMTDFAQVQVQVKIVSVDKIAIGIKIIQQKFIYIWDVTNKELIDAEFIMSSDQLPFKIFDWTFDFTFE